MSLADRWMALDKETASALALVRSLDDVAVRWKPAPAAWSARDVVEHLVIVEELVLERFDADARVTGRLRGRAAIIGMRVASWIGVKVRVPIQELNPRGDEGLASLEDRWQRVRTSLKQAVNVNPDGASDRLFLTHPAAGQLNCLDGVDFLREHVVHHRRQLDRLAALRNVALV